MMFVFWQVWFDSVVSMKQIAASTQRVKAQKSLRSDIWKSQRLKLQVIMQRTRTFAFSFFFILP